MNKIHWRRARLATACCSALTAPTLGAAGVIATAASGSGAAPVVPAKYAAAVLDSITGNWP